MLSTYHHAGQPRAGDHASSAAIRADGFGQRGMIAAVHWRGLAVDLVVAQPVFALCLSGRVADAVLEVVVGPALAGCYSLIWFLGIWPGGAGFASQFALRAATTVVEEGTLIWLLDRLIGRPVGPPMFPCYGRTDRFEQGHRMLAGSRRVDHVEVKDGGDDCAAWFALGYRVLEAVPFEISSVRDV